MSTPRPWMPWPPERVERLKALWAQGVRPSACARELGVSKNAVIGYTARNRQHFPAQALPGPPSQARWRVSAPKAQAPKKPGRVQTDAATYVRRLAAAAGRATAIAGAQDERGTTTGITIMALGYGTCRWPSWPTGTRPTIEAQRYCGDATGGGTYCPHHHGIAFARRERAA